MPSVAIIGAGLSGLAAAHTLQDASYTVTLFEKSHGVGGRAATRKRAGFIYDHGAQYIKEGTPTSLALITQRFRAPDLIDIQKPVWTFTGTGEIQTGDQTQNAEQKLNYRSGLTALPKKMAEGLTIHLDTCIVRIEQTDAGWHLFDQGGQPHDGFDALLITIPSPQTIALIQDSLLEKHIQQTILQHLTPARYNPLISVMLGYQPCPQERPYYALVNSDKKHTISWLAWEHEKAAERVPANSGLLLAQMAPDYSQEHMEHADAAIIQQVAHQVATLIQEELPEPVFSDIQRWHYALPARKADGDALNAQTLPYGLAFSGDSFVGGRLHLALEHGIMIAQKLLAQRS
ncbi:FAD-dependent oxidoreductase [Dictyobacter vulcani]|uniref:FAD-dependent oxidoreductase n=1 Tax=Dictyobacter vulcani TaxID=2607529 RepID=A0A5J4KVM2_9CHLR|nr:FAD-dependent oxidoreductase [Dictyobacter vulcani]GER89246.1 FAD-dependent oxidoreductase [Dictyobacter vulcani]